MYTMIFYIDYGYLFISYANGNGSTSLSYDDCFYCYARHDSSVNTPIPEFDFSIVIDDCVFYHMKENPKMFLGIVDNQTIGIEYWGNDLQNASEMLQNCFEIKKISEGDITYKFGGYDAFDSFKSAIYCPKIQVNFTI